MQRVIVPLEETASSESILPFAARVAGDDGIVILIGAVRPSGHKEEGQDWGEKSQAEEAAVQTYLDAVAQLLRSRHVPVHAKLYSELHMERAVEEAIREFDGTMVVTTTEGRRGSHALTWGDSAWRLLTHSAVPVLVRPGEQSITLPIDTHPHEPSRLLVPLDGSAWAERALPIAVALALQWNGTIVLIRVAEEGSEAEAKAYLEARAAELGPPCETHVRIGAPERELVQAALHLRITDIVMATHGRTGMPRVLFGSVAAELLHQLLAPIVLVPAPVPSQGLAGARDDRSHAGLPLQPVGLGR